MKVLKCHIQSRKMIKANPIWYFWSKLQLEFLNNSDSIASKSIWQQNSSRIFIRISNGKVMASLKYWNFFRSSLTLSTSLSTFLAAAIFFMFFKNWNKYKWEGTKNRYFSRFFDCLAHPNLIATLATHQKWPSRYLRTSLSKFSRVPFTIVMIPLLVPWFCTLLNLVRDTKMT